MRIFLVLAVAMSLFLAGCGQVAQPQANQEKQTLQNENWGEGADNVPVPAGGTGQQRGQQSQATGEGIIIEAPSGPGGGSAVKSSTTPATSQQDCATLTPTCKSCVSKPGCGWCKSRNGCFYGTENGPADNAACDDADWATSELECVAPVGGGACTSKTNCADCLSGSGCKWCIQGSRCADADSADECFGGWLTISYQCNYASR